MYEMNEMTEKEELEQAYCELHKDVYGVKARWYRAESVEQARADLDRLEAAGKAVWAEEAAREQARIQLVEQLVVDLHNGDFERYLRWEHDAHGTQGDDSFLEYQLGVPYGYIAQRRAK